MITVEVGSAELRLLPERAAHAPAFDALLVADVHFGKAVSFRRQGVPVPHGTTEQTLARLDAALARCGARRLVFLGDLLHSARGRAAGTLESVARWRARHPALALLLVRGNHDDRAGDPPPDWGVEVVDETHALGPWQLAHHPQASDAGYVLAGHFHPCVTLGGRAQDRLRLPCFHFGAQVGVLPAFGAFTGMHPVQREPGDRVFAIADDLVVPV